MSHSEEQAVKEEIRKALLEVVKSGETLADFIQKKMELSPKESAITMMQSMEDSRRKLYAPSSPDIDIQHKQGFSNR